MILRKIFKYSFISLLLLSSDAVWGQQNGSRELSTRPLSKEKTPLFAGLAVSADLAGFGMNFLGAEYSWMEAAGRVNLKHMYYPVAELGIGFADVVGDETDIQFKTTAPYFRAGVDYNFYKDKQSGNKLFGGLRYGFSSFAYDVLDPHFSDGVWGNGEEVFHYQDIKSNAHWAELVFGIEAKIWSIVHLGWSARYKVRLSQSDNRLGEPTYIPGFGKNGNSCWGGNFTVTLDISHLLKSSKK